MPHYASNCFESHDTGAPWPNIVPLGGARRFGSFRHDLVLNRQALADHPQINVHPNTVTRWKNAGCPFDTWRQLTLFYLPEVLEWLEEE